MFYHYSVLFISSHFSLHLRNSLSTNMFHHKFNESSAHIRACAISVQCSHLRSHYTSCCPAHSHCLLDAKINQVLSNCYDKVILTCVQCIIQNMIATEHENVSQQLHSIQAYGFGGLWRFAGPFTKVRLALSTLNWEDVTFVPMGIGWNDMMGASGCSGVRVFRSSKLCRKV